MVTQADVRKQIDIATQICEVGAVYIHKLKMQPTAVFDIDATLITDSSRTQQPIIPMLMLVDRLQKLGVKVFLVTARTSDGYAHTRAQLNNLAHEHHCLHNIELYCLPLETVGSSNIVKMSSRKQYEVIALFKYLMRWLVHMRVGPLLIAVGDSVWDVSRATSKSDEETDSLYLQLKPRNEAEFVAFKVPRSVMGKWRNMPTRAKSNKNRN